MESTRSLRIVRMCGVPNILFYCCCADNIFPASAEKIRSGLSSCQLSFSHYPLYYACRGQGNRFSIRALIRKLYFFLHEKRWARPLLFFFAVAVSAFRFCVEIVILVPAMIFCFEREKTKQVCLRSVKLHMPDRSVTCRNLPELTESKRISDT